ncbi:4-(cytidine 5'-diphospho)-2-C-methyl-D-erythritol kinase [Roseateles sp. SL47]|uniref:4-(cytidine 5'-diphospho)-2-C-methyl-D-erythritol kinase n=1 Tax=Roseateles sp. SL47 TaxID=2995138 RepID=UPI003B63332D
MQALYDVPAPAKLNLFLHVVGKRPDGYHLLQSLFVLIDWADTLHFERRADGALHRHDQGDALPPDDLCLRAARALQAASGTSFGADIHIEKRLPAGAGMGGGSSDAASTLLALNRLWGLHWPRSRLQPIALQLGADVPFFVGGRNAFVEGIGEILHAVQVPPTRLAVVKPAVSIGTKEIFSSPLLQRSESVAIVAGFPAVNGGHEASETNSAKPIAEWNQSQVNTGHAGVGSLSKSDDAQNMRNVVSDAMLKKLCEQAVSGWGRNDLQAPAEAASHEVSDALHWLQTRYGNSRMTGSGSAVFAILPASQQDADDSNASLGSNSKATSEAKANGSLNISYPFDLPPKWAGRMCRSLEVHPLLGWATD